MSDSLYSTASAAAFAAGSIDPAVQRVGLNYRRQRIALSAAIRSGNLDRVIAACDTALASFDLHGFPDDWQHFERARTDALVCRAYEV